MQIEIPEFKGEDSKYYELLIEAREKYLQQFNFHTSEAIDYSKSSAGEVTGVSTHMADVATDLSRHDMELELLTRESDSLEQIDEAIERLINGEYGICFDCGCNVNKERLEVKPHAKYCINCKSVREENGGMRPDLYDYDEYGNEIERN
jgi:DnaK suppressor protein